MNEPATFPPTPAELARAARHEMRTGDNREAMTLLAEAFHVLEDRPGVRPWDAEKLYAWAMGPEATSSMRHVVRFVLSVWNPTTIEILDSTENAELAASGAEDLGELDLMAAMGSWDSLNRAAFVAWASDPWWP